MPWQRLFREWLIYVVIMLAVFLFIFQDRSAAGIVVGLALSGPLYLGYGYVLAKLGVERKSLKQRREEAAQSPSGSGESSSSGSSSRNRPKPAPTSRTNANNRQRPKGRKR